MTTIEQVIHRVRSQLAGSFSMGFGRVDSPYVSGATTLSLKDLSPGGIPPGSMVCVGLTTFEVIAADGGTLTVVPSVDGSPGANYSTNTLAALAPLHSTFSIFNEINMVIGELSSAANGLYQVETETLVPDQSWNTYTLATTPLKVLRLAYLEPGTPDVWHDIQFRYTPGATGGAQIRTGDLPFGVTSLQVEYATPFTEATALSDTVVSLGMPDRYASLLSIGAARYLSLATESRRVQPYSQGDPRRAAEVPITGNVVVFDRLERRFRTMVNQERASLVRQHPYTMPVGQW